MPRAHAKLDPVLVQQLSAAQQTSSGPIEAVVYLRPTHGQAALQADRVEGTVSALLDRVNQSTGRRPRDYNTFRNLGSFVVVAEASFIRELIKQPEVASAMANRATA